MAHSATVRNRLRSNWSFNADANTGHGFAIFMASVGALRPGGLRRRLTWALGAIMLFGDPSTFAIEASSAEQSKSSGVWGSMRVFCQGHPMGNLAEGNCSLFPAYQGFDRVLTRLREGSLQHKFISGLDHASSHRVLAQALFGEWSDNSECAPDELWDHSLLNNWGPQFDDVPLTFIRSDGSSVVISQELSESTTAISLFRIPTDAMLYALDEFCCWYELQEQVCAQSQ